MKRRTLRIIVAPQERLARFENAGTLSFSAAILGTLEVAGVVFTVYTSTSYQCEWVVADVRGAENVWWFSQGFVIGPTLSTRLNVIVNGVLMDFQGGTPPHFPKANKATHPPCHLRKK